MSGVIGVCGVTPIRKERPSIIAELRQARIENGISQKQLAERAGYNVDTIIRWERGDMPPTLTRLCDWCEALGFKLALERASP